MKNAAALILSACLMGTPVLAQEGDANDGGRSGDMQQGMTLLQEGARLFFKGLTDEMEPKLNELAQHLRPAMRELMLLIDDFDAYELPEKLPNGDIIIRRKTPLPPEPGTDGEIEL